MKAFRDGTRPFPDGAVIVRLAGCYQSPPRNDAVFRAPQSYVAGAPTNVQVSVKHAKRYAATGGWGYGQFEGGRPNPDPAVAQSCFARHQKLEAMEKGTDFVFTAYAEIGAPPPYQGSGPSSLKKPPLGPSSANVAKVTTTRAP